MCLSLSSFFFFLKKNCPSLNSLCSPDKSWNWDASASDSQVAGSWVCATRPGYSLFLTCLVLNNSSPVYQLYPVSLDGRHQSIFFKIPCPWLSARQLTPTGSSWGYLVLTQPVSSRSHHFPLKPVPVLTSQFLLTTLSFVTKSPTLCWVWIISPIYPLNGISLQVTVSNSLPPLLSARQNSCPQSSESCEAAKQMWKRINW